ncbi:MAG: 23S rRNA (guanosine(2251)-2'-O)-methyltransferase RlmB, partial [Gammaproteobacteria bacterium]|nr:23S rRNA (guanosine(2251)-2'-O)-methyltransferase RlmB [Gammaproteobacteria bacterium]
MSDSFVYGIHAVEKFIQKSSQHGIELLVIERRSPRLLSIIGQAQKV